MTLTDCNDVKARERASAASRWDRPWLLYHSSRFLRFRPMPVKASELVTVPLPLPPKGIAGWLYVRCVTAGEAERRQDVCIRQGREILERL